LHIAQEGTPVPHIDEAMKRWGMPMGPFELLDEIGLDVAAYVLKSLAPTGKADDAVPAGLKQAIENGWLGKKSGRGFYIHPKQTRRGPVKDLQPNEEVLRMIQPTAAQADNKQEAPIAAADTIQSRLVMPMVHEAAKLMEERVIESTDTLDLATVLGLGLAPFRGGLVQFATAAGKWQTKTNPDRVAAAPPAAPTTQSAPAMQAQH
jgi:3-hydroxyacyl-CoA dehydrogenase/enoyl-CoA hydratase/3-hydroxybutyryl-CoA epimerase